MGGGIIIGRERGGGGPLPFAAHTRIHSFPSRKKEQKNRYEIQNPTKNIYCTLLRVWKRNSSASIKYRILVSNVERRRKHSTYCTGKYYQEKFARKERWVRFAHFILMTLKDWETSVGSREKFPLGLASFRIRSMVFFLQQLKVYSAYSKLEWETKWTKKKMQSQVFLSSRQKIICIFFLFRCICWLWTLEAEERQGRNALKKSYLWRRAFCHKSSRVVVKFKPFLFQIRMQSYKIDGHANTCFAFSWVVLKSVFYKSGFTIFSSFPSVRRTSLFCFELFICFVPKTWCVHINNILKFPCSYVSKKI